MSPLIREIKIITLREVEGEYDGQCASSIFDFWKNVITQQDWFDSEKEAFVVVTLDSKLQVKDYNLVSLGNLNTTLTHPREVFRAAVTAAAASIVLIHNHPTGDTTPSPDDIEATKTCIQAGDILGVTVLDHIIVGNDFFSMRDQGSVEFPD